MISFRSITPLLFLSILAGPLGAQLTPRQRLAREVYSELISINTMDSVGSVTKAAEAMAARFRAAGFPVPRCQGPHPAGKPNKGNPGRPFPRGGSLEPRQADSRAGAPRRRCRP